MNLDALAFDGARAIGQINRVNFSQFKVIRVIHLIASIMFISGLLGYSFVSRDVIGQFALFSDQSSDVILGKAQGSRWDEMSAITPYALANKHLGPLLDVRAPMNPFIGLGAAFYPTGYIAHPSSFWSILFSPHSLFFIFDPSPVNWGITLVVLQILCLYSTFFLLKAYDVEGPSLCLLFGVFMLAWSPFVQKWFVSGIGLAACYVGFWVFSGVRLLRAQYFKEKLLYSILFFWMSGCFLTSGYAPAVYAFALVSIPIFLEELFKKDNLLRPMLLKFGLIFFVFSLSLFIVAIGPVGDLYRHLSGSFLADRSYDGGGYYRKILLSVLWPRTNYFGNEAEDSALFAGLPLIFFIFFGWRSFSWNTFFKKNVKIISLLILILSWMLIAIPGEWGRYILLNRVSSFRISSGFYLLLGVLLVRLLSMWSPASIWLKRSLNGVFIAQSLLLFKMGLLWNPITNLNSWDKPLTYVEHLRETVGSGLVLPNSTAVGASNLLPFGIRSLLGRLEGVNPEMLAALMPMEAGNTEESSWKERLFGMYHFAWEPIESWDTKKGSPFSLHVDPCALKVWQWGVRALVLRKDIGEKVLSRCSDQWEVAFSIPSSPSEQIVWRARKPWPWLTLIPQGVSPDSVEISFMHELPLLNTKAKNVGVMSHRFQISGKIQKDKKVVSIFKSEYEASLGSEGITIIPLHWEEFDVSGKKMSNILQPVAVWALEGRHFEVSADNYFKNGSSCLLLRTTNISYEDYLKSSNCVLKKWPVREFNERMIIPFRTL